MWERDVRCCVVREYRLHRVRCRHEGRCPARTICIDTYVVNFPVNRQQLASNLWLSWTNQPPLAAPSYNNGTKLSKYRNVHCDCTAVRLQSWKQSTPLQTS